MPPADMSERREQKQMRRVRGGESESESESEWEWEVARVGGSESAERMRVGVVRVGEWESW